MIVREIKEEDIKVGLRVIHEIDYRRERHGRIIKVISLSNPFAPPDFPAVTCDDGSWVTYHDLTHHYYMIVDDNPTGIPTFDGDINQQIGGTHYTKNDPIQFAKDNYPPEHLEGFYRINVDKYMARYDKKNGIEDIKKAKHYIEMLLELKLREKSNAK